jgi:hypothetical protein
MDARNRLLPEWFNRIRSRQITLPRFQRFEAWGHEEVSGLLTTVLRGLPSGATLILEVGDREKFISRTMVDAPETGERITEQLLDGQQRLTALWRSLHGKYGDRSYLIKLLADPDNDPNELPYVHGQARWDKNGMRYPLWVDDPRECWSRGYIPITLLRPGDLTGEIRQWLNKAIGNGHDQYDKLFDEIGNLRRKVDAFNLPYLALPSTTNKEVALEVFRRMNTSAVTLSTYDIIVALVEGETGKSLHDHVNLLDTSVPRAQDYAILPNLVLDVVALRQDRTPSQAGYQGINFTRMVNEWDTIVGSIEWMVGFVKDECIFDAQRLPSYTAIPILAALWEHLPTQPDKLGNARLLLRKFLWRAFLTTRYEQSSASNALQDYRKLRRVLCENEPESAVPILNQESYPLPTRELVLHADWPKRKSILGRGLLALQIKCGAEDLADGAKATVETITSKTCPREYHHLFPAALLEDAEISHEQIFRALNCALVTWHTNRTISNKDPIKYLEERAINCSLGEEELKRRLKTHLIPYAQLAVGYDGLSDGERRNRVKNDYDAFLSARAEILAKAAQCACEGKSLVISELMNESE